MPLLAKKAKKFSRVDVGFPNSLSDNIVKPREKSCTRIVAYTMAFWLSVTGISLGGDFRIMRLDWERKEAKLLRGTDKMEHMLLTAQITERGSEVLEKIGVPHPRALASTMAMAIGFGIELYDGTVGFKKSRGASFSDIAANLIGVVQANLKIKTNGSFGYGFTQRFDDRRLEHNPAIWWVSFQPTEIDHYPVWITFSFSNYDKMKNGTNNPNLPGNGEREKVVGTKSGNFNLVFSVSGF